MSKKICAECKFESPDDAKFCLKCGAKLKEAKSEKNKTEEAKEKETVIKLEIPIGPKSRIAAGLLAVFVGTFGIHNFYLGYNKRGLTQLLLSVVGGVLTCGLASMVVGIWSLVEGILIFTKAEGYTVDAEGKPLGD